MVQFSVSNRPSDPSGASVGEHGGALAILASVFFMWGFITVLNDILVPHLKAVFELSFTQSMMIQFVFFGTYFLMALPAAKMLERTGYKHAIAIGLLTSGVGALIFVPAATTASYRLFLIGLFVLAAGITTLQVAANPYVALLGPSATASSRLNLVQAFNSLGTTMAPAFGGMLILANSTSGMTADGLGRLTAGQRLADALAVRTPYVGIAVTLFVLAGVILTWHLPKLKTRPEPRETGHPSIWTHSRLVYGLGAIFFYVGAEIAVGSFLINYISSPSVGAMSHAAASFYVTLFWGGAMLGRFAGAAVMRRVPAASVLAAVSVGAIALLALTMSTTGEIALWAIVSVGLMNAIMFPTIFTLAIQGLEKLTAQGSALLIMAIVGGALVPVLQGLAADAYGLRLAFCLPLACYAYVLTFAIYCRRTQAILDVPGET
ncbi:FHS family L-fucose permease-like MFS transporter [Sphingomonas sp. PP-F2F-A104-K0414]|uniref:sugar MFS transporter n=1 Tax=Sphingomonas sp. PP-F2F-A104-K0414 TaxID=2135661 RepID=UPI00104564F8|nr:sugar MFS transporter [Sphingomonas sp. PP-F2F-A104-K0414]TCP96387.1 FHS family L-fucose permease-like MFS transporter [Sphingomonas sp. PP-F2F-A104-K0414]